MADVPATPGVTPGNTTSEYKQTKIATIISIVATAVGLLTSFLETLNSALPGAKWVSLALTVLGMVGTILATLGYQTTRANVKVAALAASGQPPTVASSEAAATLAKVP